MSFDGVNIPLNSELTKKLSESSKPVVIKKDNLVVVGETHIKTLSDETVEQQFLQDLSHSSIVVVEHDSLSDNVYSQESPEKRFMQQAQEHAIEFKKPLVILDNEITDRYKLWLDAGVDISREDYSLLIGMYSLFTDFQKQVPLNQSVQKLIQLYSGFFDGQTEYANQMAQAAYTCIFGQEEIDRIGEKIPLMIDFVQLDSLARERYYQTRTAQIKQANSEYTLVVVGKDHALPISQTLTDGHLSSIDPSFSAKINTSLSAVKDRINFTNIVK